MYQPKHTYQSVMVVLSLPELCVLISVDDVLFPIPLHITTELARAPEHVVFQFTINNPFFLRT